MQIIPGLIHGNIQVGCLDSSTDVGKVNLNIYLDLWQGAVVSDAPECRSNTAFWEKQ